ncbi:hypothetical protein [Nostoc sp.]
MGSDSVAGFQELYSYGEASYTQHLRQEKEVAWKSPVRALAH